MYPHVPVQIAALRKSEQAQFTFVRFLAAVDPKMLRERAAVRERLLAKPATVGPFAGMRTHVSRDRGRLGKAPVAHRTAERLFPAVGANVRSKVGRLREGLIAIYTPVRFFAGMGA